MNADDFGLSEGVNQGILAALRGGILRSASLMPNGAAFEDAVRIARATPQMGVGIHISLVGETPVAPRAEISGLADEEGLLPASYTAFVRAYLARRFTAEHIRREVAAQVHRVLDTGLCPTHLDSHQHVHLLPTVFDIAVEAAVKAGIRVIRIPEERGLPLPFTPRAAQLRALGALCPRARRRAHAAGLRTASHFQGLAVSGSLNEAALMRFIRDAGPGVHEIMAHPGHSDVALREKYQWGYNWDEEAAALQCATVLRIVQERGIQLAHFGNAWNE